MAKLRFDEVHPTQFKGITDATYKLFEKTDIVGKNGAGKSTVGISLVLPFTGKDLLGKSNPEIRPDFLPESEPHIEINADIDGKPIQIEMFQKDMRSKKDIAEGKPAKISNKYRINGVDKSATSFKTEMESRGIDLSKYEMLTSTSYFENLKEADKRAMVFGLASDITDMDVVNALGEEAELIKQKLENYTLVEIESLAKRDKKAASERLDAIPEQIVGLEKAIPDIGDLAVLQSDKEKTESQLSEVESEIQNIRDEMPSKEKIDSEVREIEKRKSELVQLSNNERWRKKDEASTDLEHAKTKYYNAENGRDLCEKRLRHAESFVDSLQKQAKEMLTEFTKLKDATFPRELTICPTCGSTFDPEYIDITRTEWQKKHDLRVKNMRDSGNNIVAEFKKAKADAENISEELEELKSNMDEAKANYDKAEQKYKKICAEKEITESDIPECAELDKRKAEMQEQLAKISEYQHKLHGRSEMKLALEIRLEGINKQLGKQEVVEDIKQQIKALEEEKRTTAQALADAEAILYQIGLVSRKKNEMLSDSVNSHFNENIRFKLYDVQKNGELKDVCVPLVKNEQGEWKELGKTANASLELMAKIAILDGFQRFYNLSLPIICDNSESMDTHTKSLIKTDCQLIFLTVKDDAQLTVTELK